ncbi:MULTISPECIES: uracil-DNA glycosylase family protein [unclassified Hwanghaeella]|jgi:uracil-DNA glycosylase|uniref:uracil-DNA glycosylase family protein n=1 Tax=unclassified Hwanghaeella TaxID=2605944 RepID=UPI000C89A4AB|nr:uracil-DNA glycosylase [Rhodospirillales bacterium]|tara:strand:+ start:7667 stop:8254 length:588 start_codon:yes stop_codon:yes gene_type:complete
MSLNTLLKEVRACTLCADHLPLGPRPVVRMTPSARLMIIGQAPGTKVHETGIPWNDPSGERLRDWMQINPDHFYDDQKVAIMPMGFCYPGRNPKGGDMPPRPECAPTWHDRLRAHLPNLTLTLLVGSYAQRRYLGSGQTMTQAVRNFQHHLQAGILPLPHPSWRTVAWQRKNPWFDTDVLPLLREKVAQTLHLVS